MDRKYKITVIGAGARGTTYLSMLKKYHEKEVVFAGICDVLPDRADKAFEEYGFAEKHADFKTAIASTKPDLVIVATPAYFHCDIASFAMDNGCHVLSEKPFDLSLDKCFKLRDKAKETGKKLAIGLQYRNRLQSRAIKRVMDRRLLGKNVVMSFMDVRENRPKLAMHDAAFGNGGPMTDMACHYFDLMRWYYGSEPKSVSAVWRKSSEERPYLASIETKAPDSAVITVEYESGDMGTMIVNWSLPIHKGKSLNPSTISGSEGFVFLSETRNAPEVKLLSNGEEMTVTHESEDEADCVGAEKGVFDHFIAEIEGKGKIQASFDEGIASLACSMAAIKSGALGRAVSVREILETRPTILDCMGAGK